MNQTINILMGDAGSDITRIMKRAALSIPDVVISGIVRSREMLIAKLKHLDVDLVLLDLDITDMGGSGLIEEIKRLKPVVMVVLVSDNETADPETAVKALESGASDCIEKPHGSDDSFYNKFRLQLITIIGLAKSRKAFFPRSEAAEKRPAKAKPDREPSPSMVEKKPDGPDKWFFPGTAARITCVNVVVIASSTGGPGALVEVLPKLPENLGVPVLLVQHMPSHMTASLAKSLNSQSALEVTEAIHGDEILPSKIYIAPGGRHMTVSQKDGDNRRYIRLNDKPPENSVRPSADVLFRSVARSYDGNILAVILTGMGVDGKKGVKAMKEKGCLCFSQSEATCVVYGMPKAVNLAGLSDDSLDLDVIASRIVAAVKRGQLK